MTNFGSEQVDGMNHPLFKHGLSTHPLYHIWHAMKQRCYDETFPNYHRYGGRGIIVEDVWKTDFLAFYNWALPIYKKGLEIDRIDNNGNYCPENCRFVTRKVNQNNTIKQEKQYLIKNISHSYQEWTNILGITKKQFFQRLKEWTDEDILAGKKTRKKSIKTGKLYFGKTMKQWSAELGISVKRVSQKIIQGRSPDDPPKTRKVPKNYKKKNFS